MLTSVLRLTWKSLFPSFLSWTALFSFAHSFSTISEIKIEVLRPASPSAELLLGNIISASHFLRDIQLLEFCALSGIPGGYPVGATQYPPTVSFSSYASLAHWMATRYECYWINQYCSTNATRPERVLLSHSAPLPMFWFVTISPRICAEVTLAKVVDIDVDEISGKIFHSFQSGRVHFANSQ